MISRRSMLTALGLGAGSLFLPSLRGRGLVHAGPAEPPKRLIVISTGHGTVRTNWDMRPTGLSGSAIEDWEFPLTTQGLEFSRILAPFAPLAAKTLVVDGTAQYSSIAAGGNGHYTGAISCFTSTIWRDITNGGADLVLVARGPSVDQIVAKQIARADRIPSLELGGGHVGTIYDDQGMPLPSEGLPTQLFQRLFGKPPVDESSMLDLVSGQYANMAARLGGDDRQKLAQHQQLVRDLEVRIAGLATLQCNAPTPPSDPDYTLPSGQYKARFDAFTSLLVAAMSCDITRVASIQVEGPSLADIDAPPGGDLHSDYAHHDDDAIDPTPEGIEIMTRYHTYDATRIAALASALDAVPEGGGTMLDNTLILWGGELATGNHAYHRMPYVMIGGAGGKFKTGRYVHYGQRFPGPGNRSDRVLLGPPHAKLLTTIAQAFGVDTNLVGVTDVTLVGRSIDLSGALERLS